MAGASSPLPDDRSPDRPTLQAVRSPWLTRLISPQSNQLTLVGHLALAGSLLLGSLSLNVWMFAFASSQEGDWLNLSTVAKTRADSQALVTNVQATAAERSRMVDQFMLIQARVETHVQVMGLFYKLNFIALGTIGWATGLASISLFFISKVGWEQVNNALINLFIVSSGLVIFHSNLILIFKFQDNIQLNGQLYTEYTQLYNAVLSYWAIQPSTPNSPTPADFIVATDQRLTELGQIALDFDVSRVSQWSQPLEGAGAEPSP
ncbi:hypothetical protein C8255_02300 [filamentous cyanobacterium CCP3]|nr:hypothetical protein C8255_02300 [filamentous cyanobacterium CCP3]